MLELVLILYGAEVARRRWWMLGLVGLLWLFLGAYFLVDAFTDDTRINPVFFVVPLVIDAVFCLVSARGSLGTAKRLRYARAGVFLLIALLVIATAGRGEILVGLVAGTFLIADAAWRGVSAYVVRFAGWHRAIALAGAEFLIGLWSFLPWPSRWQGEVGSDVGLLIMLSALNICALAWRLAWLPAGAPLSRIVAEGLLQHGDGRAIAKAIGPAEQKGPAVRGTATVHVWTPTGALASVDRAVSRYVAARDARGVISTGHAALEGAGLYMSHYPAVEIDRSATDFRRTLRATRDNDVPGRFLPSYAEEAADWCESTMKVGIPGMDEAALHNFWARYGADNTYNLTSRNCSSTVATALDAGLEGVFAPYARSVSFLIRLLLSSELWIAAQMRSRAAAMAWTPGIVLDYARALSYIVALPRQLGMKPARD